jgi:hypothetical protein
MNECRLCGEQSGDRFYCEDCLSWDKSQNDGRLEHAEMNHCVATVLSGLKDLGLRPEED